MSNRTTPTEESPLDLTARQKEISTLIVLGKTNKQIASELSISEQCVKIHVSNLLKRTGTPNRTGLAVELARRRIEAG